MSSKINIFSGLLIGLFTGALIGSAAALLSAPQPGDQTRAILKEKSDELVKRAEVSLQETRQRLDAALADVRNHSIELTHSYGRGADQFLSQEILAE
jgi:gas vesicle protein